MEHEERNSRMHLRVDSALRCFSRGFNCSQSIFAAYAPLLAELSHEQALRIAGGFGAGMGRLQDVCGAVTGAFMLIGLKHGMVQEGDLAAKEETYARVQEFARRFREKNGSLVCRELLGCDLGSDEGRRDFAERNLHTTICARCVRDAALLVEELIVTDRNDSSPSLPQ